MGDFINRRRPALDARLCFWESPYSCPKRPFQSYRQEGEAPIWWGQVRVYSLSYLQFSSFCALLHLPPQAFVLPLVFALFCFLFIFFSFMIVSPFESVCLHRQFVKEGIFYSLSILEKCGKSLAFAPVRVYNNREEKRRKNRYVSHRFGRA